MYARSAGKNPLKPGFRDAIVVRICITLGLPLRLWTEVVSEVRTMTFFGAVKVVQADSVELRRRMEVDSMKRGGLKGLKGLKSSFNARSRGSSAMVFEEK